MIIDREDRAVFSEQLCNRRRRGRPRIPTVPTSVKLTEPVFDALCRMAQRNGDSLHETMRKALELYASSGILGSQNNPSVTRQW